MRFNTLRKRFLHNFSDPGMRAKVLALVGGKAIGLTLWIVFAPAAIGLLPGHLLWRNALPVEGITGRLLADAMVHYLNLPGASIVLALRRQAL